MTCGKAPGNAQCLYRGVMEYTQKKKKKRNLPLGMNLTEECVIRDFQKCQKYKQEKKSGKTGQIRNDQRVMRTKKTVSLIEKKKRL